MAEDAKKSRARHLRWRSANPEKWKRMRKAQKTRYYAATRKNNRLPRWQRKARWVFLDHTMVKRVTSVSGMMILKITIYQLKRRMTPARKWQ